MKYAHLVLPLSLLGSVVAAACSATGGHSSGTLTGLGGSGGTGGHTTGQSSGSTSGKSSSGASTSSGMVSSSGTASSSGSASSSGAASSSGTTSSSTSSSTGATFPINFDGGWQVPDAGMIPPPDGGGGTSTVIGPGANPSSPGAFGGGSGTAPTLVYPPSGVILPPNTNALEFHFIPAAGQTLFRFTFHSPSFTLIVYTGCTPLNNGCVYTPDPSFWGSLVPSARGTAPVAYTLEGVNGGSPGAVGKASATMAFGEQDMTGGIYYWNTGGIIQRYDYGFPNAPAQNYFTALNAGAIFCVGCHVVSRQGDKMAVGKDIPAPAAFGVFDVVSKTVEMAGGGPIQGAANFSSFSPDGNYLLTSDGASIQWLDLFTNKALPGPVVASGTMPDWAPDGLHMVYASPQSPAFFGVPGVSSASIVRLHFNGTTWDTPTTLVPFAGQNNYYPAFSPTGQWVVFDRSPSNAESFSNASPDPDAGTVPDGELWTVSANGGNAVRLSSASNPGACSWPKWAPVQHNYYGGNILWLTFSSARAYGLRLPAGQETQLWMVAFDPAKAAAGQDPSYPAFWLPFQDMGSGNHIAQWSIKVPRKACPGGTSQCDPGEVCQSGNCVPG